MISPLALHVRFEMADLRDRVDVYVGLLHQQHHSIQQLMAQVTDLSYRVACLELQQQQQQQQPPSLLRH